MFLVENAGSIWPMILWIVVFLLTLGLEIATQDLISVWFCIGSIPSLIMACFYVDFKFQILVFAIVSAVFFILSELFIKKRLKKNEAKELNTIVGMELVVLKSVFPTENGEGKIRDVVWTIKSKDTIEKGQFAIVKEVRGNVLVVSKEEK